MGRFKYPDPVVFDYWETEGVLVGRIKLVDNYGVRALNDCVKMVSAAENYERWIDMPGHMRADASRAKKKILDCAMDLYQSVVDDERGNIDTEYELAGTEELDRSGAMSVLLNTAIYFTDCTFGCEDPNSKYDAPNVLESLAMFLSGEYTDDEIAEAYGRCVERNRNAIEKEKEGQSV